MEREIVRVEIGRLMPGDSPRLDGQDEAHIARLAQVDAPLPPILVDRRTMRVVDGTHRLMAALLRGEDSIEAEFFDGEAADAFLRAVQENIAHGFPLSLADRRAAAARIVTTHPHLSDRAIADVTGLGAKTVGSIRRHETQVPWPAARMGRDGRVRPLDGAQARRRVAELFAQEPQSSARAVARAAGVSPATAADVRRRLNGGEDPAPERTPRVRARSRGAQMVPASVLDKLLRDPSLRHNEEGRQLLRLLRSCAIAPQEWSDLMAVVPSHCADLVGQMARQNSQMWSSFAQKLTERAHSPHEPPYAAASGE